MERLSPKELFTQYYPRLCHFAWQLLSDKEMVQDVVQDVFLTYWGRHEELKSDPAAVKSFLYITVKNACLNIRRHEKVVEKYRMLTPFQEAEESGIMRKIIRAEIMVEVFEIMKSMPEGCREVFRLGYLEGLSNIQIAEHLQIGVTTVKTQKQRALKLIKSKLNPDFFTLFVFFFEIY